MALAQSDHDAIIRLEQQLIALIGRMDDHLIRADAAVTALNDHLKAPHNASATGPWMTDKRALFMGLGIGAGAMGVAGGSFAVVLRALGV